MKQEEDKRENEASKTHGLWKKVKDILSWMLVVVAGSAVIFTVFATNNFNRRDSSWFGYKFFVAQTSSMAATDFEAGDLVVSKSDPDIASLSEGDIITFISQNELHYGKTVTHKIREVKTDEFGRKEFTTYGTTTNTDDNTPVTEDRIIGEYKFRIPKVGIFFAFIKTIPGYFACVFVPSIIVLLINGKEFFRLLREYKEKDGKEIE